MFINFTENTGLSINSYRNPAAMDGDVGDVLIAMEKGFGTVCCELDGAKDALEDGFYLSGLSISQETIEDLHHFIVNYQP